MPIQLCCLCVETFAFWLVIYMKHSIHLTITHRIHFSVIYDVHVSASTKLMTRYLPSRGRTNAGNNIISGQGRYTIARHGRALMIENLVEGR